ncbi:hypothetical protein RclHR1_09550007 [Rhizophagus clarus]|uniref:DDE-1 domain-containing protein n=1 Tax=Rhizophagus clarus TaxID=94130 RepID=A0A2Z6S526_9GLOM|nr:hypothetical protein RclHR1_09550007 [Rhizophagus clarus]
MFKILEESDIIALYSDVTESFKGSLRWLNCFMKRYKLSLRRHTKVSQKLLQQTEELLENFCQYVMHLRIENSYELCNIFNMDEMPVYFDMASNFTINPKGDKTIHIRCTSNEKNCFTVMLTCMGSSYPPICIFKEKRMPHGEHLPTGIIVWFQENGWMDANLMKDYINYFKDAVISRPRTPKMMVYDSFRGHLYDSIKKDFHEIGFDLAVIPDGLTSICQPLDITINKPFKDNL